MCIRSMLGQLRTNTEIPTLLSVDVKSQNLEPPIFTGKGDWESFLLQFEMLADRYNCCIDRKREEIIFCLKDEALSFVTQLSVEVRSEWLYLIESMNRRFGDHTLPETHRRELQQIRKASGESFQEYSTRIEAKMSKAYPGMQNTEIYKRFKH